MGAEEASLMSQRRYGLSRYPGGDYAIHDGQSRRDVAIVMETSGRDADRAATLFAASPELLAALLTAEDVIRSAAYEARGKVKKDLVGGWLHHANEIRRAIWNATLSD